MRLDNMSPEVETKPSLTLTAQTVRRAPPPSTRQAVRAVTVRVLPSNNGQASTPSAVHTSKYGVFTLPDARTWQLMFSVLQSEEGVDVDAPTQRTIHTNYELGTSPDGEMQIMGRSNRRARFGGAYILPVCREEGVHQAITECHDEMGHATAVETHDRLLTRWHDVPFTRVERVVAQCPHCTEGTDVSSKRRRVDNGPPPSLERATMVAPTMERAPPALSPQSVDARPSIDQIIMASTVTAMPQPAVDARCFAPPLRVDERTDTRQLDARRLHLECRRLTQTIAHETEKHAVEMRVLAMKERKLAAELALLERQNPQ